MAAAAAVATATAAARLGALDDWEAARARILLDAFWTLEHAGPRFPMAARRGVPQRLAREAGAAPVARLVARPAEVVVASELMDRQALLFERVDTHPVSRKDGDMVSP